MADLLHAVSGLNALEAIKQGYEQFSIHEPFHFVHTADPLVVLFFFVTALSIVTLIASEITGHLSYVDKLWSILPPAYVWYFTFRSYDEDTKTVHPRLLLMAVLSTLWGARLTFNFWRRGGYSMEEDYRWPYLRARLPAFLLSLLDLVFIATFQHYLLFGLSLPAYVVYQTRGYATGLNDLDLFAALLFVTLLVGELVSDQQQYNFQEEKYRKIRAGEPLHGDYKRGFLTEGLFSVSRHPNFFCEMSIWWSFYLFSVAALFAHRGALTENNAAHGIFLGGILNWSILGPIVLTLLFQASTNFTEKITSEKYPLYAEYQKTTAKFVPFYKDTHDKQK